MSNILLSYEFILITLFFFIFCVRKLIFRRPFFGFLFYIILLVTIYMINTVNSLIKREMNDHLDQFIILEQNNKLFEARNDPNPENPILQSNIRYYENSSDFKKFILEREQYTTMLIKYIFITIFVSMLIDILFIKYQLKKQ